MLPNFIVIGAAKAGTTALYWYLDEHPQVYMSPVKETNFFAYGEDESGEPLYGDPDLHRFPVRTFADYEALFAKADGASAIGEASPIYLECPDTARRIRTTIPDARIICGLRNPIERAYADYLMYLRSRGRRFEPERDLSPGAPWARPDSHWMRIGQYHELLSRYTEIFPWPHIHVFLFDDLRHSPEQVVGTIYEYLGIDPAFVPDFATPHNIGGVPESMALERFYTNKTIKAALEPWIPRRVANWVRRLRTSNLSPAPPLPDELRNELAPHFHDEILKTAELIERDLDAWL